MHNRVRKYIAAVVTLTMLFSLGFPVKAAEDFEIEDNVLVAYHGTDQNIVVPDGVEKIGPAAFKNKQIISVQIPSSVKEIGESAFEKCTGLERITFAGSGLQQIGQKAFSSCKKLKYMALPEGLEEIGDKAFLSSGIVFAEMPASLKRIGKSAYYNSKIKAVHLNQGLESIGASAFETCYQLQGLRVPASVAEVGSSFAGDNGSPFQWLLFENDAAVIGANPTDQMSIVYYGGGPSTIQEIYQKIYDKNNNTKLKFANKESFESFDIFKLDETEKALSPDEEYQIELTASPAAITFGTVNYLSLEPQIAEVTADGKVTAHKVGETKILVFHADQRLAVLDIDVVGGGNLFKVDAAGRLVKYYGHDTEIVLPDEVDGRAVTALAANAFRGNSKITKLTLGANITKLEKEALKNCIALREIVFNQGLQEIDEAVFFGCEQLTELHLPDSVTVLGKSALERMGSLQTLTLSRQLSAIPENMCSNCFSLRQIVIPAECTKIGKAAFLGCRGLESIEWNQKLTEIEESAFKSCLKIEKLTLPEGITTIGKQAFLGMDSMTEITLPSTFIEFKADTLADLFESFDNDSTVKLQAINIAPGNSRFYSEDGLVYEGQTLVYIPQGLAQVSVKAGTEIIGERAGKTHMRLEKVVLPEGVKIVGVSAFQNCFALEEINLPQSLRRIEPFAFLGCEELKEINIPKDLEYIGKLALYELEKIKQLVVPEKIEKIEEYAVAGNDEMEHLILPRNLKEIAKCGASFCKSLKELYLPEKQLLSIGDQGFGACYELEHLELPQSLQSIGEEGFSYGQKLKSIYLPGSVVLGKNVFKETLPSQKVWVFTHDENDTIKQLTADPARFCKVDLDYQKNTDGKIEVQRLEGLLNGSNENHVFVLKVNESQPNAAVRRFSVSAEEESRPLERPYHPMTLVVELPLTAEGKNVKLYQQENGRYKELAVDRLERFLRAEIDSFGEFVVAEDFNTLAPYVPSTSETAAVNAAPDKPTILPEETKVPAGPADIAGFKDVQPQDWFYADVKMVQQLGLMQGMTDNHFQPQATGTRAMFVQILYRMAGQEQMQKAENAAWYQPAMNWAVTNQIIQGRSDGDQPSAAITREEVAVLLYRYYSRKMSQSAKAEMTFKDADQISAWAQEAMQWAVAAGIYQGRDNGLLQPQAFITRAEIAAIIVRAQKLEL